MKEGAGIVLREKQAGFKGVTPSTYNPALHRKLTWQMEHIFQKHLHPLHYQTCNVPIMIS